ncbi:MAG TPA: carboxypeptidase regulatory-like domain-containing protein [Vicinamibacterales bacterium]|jgi:hypothetical protein
MVKRTVLALLLLTALCLSAVPAVAQETTGTIVGTVTDESGAVVPGVAVVAKNINTGRTTEVVSTSTGIYRIPLLPPGVYDLTFQLSGFQPVTIRGIALHVNDRLDVNGKLSVGGVAEVVEVTAAQQFVQPTAALQNLVDATQVQELPLNNRNFVQLATLAPGVSSDLPDEVGVGLTSTVSISVNGSRRNAVNWLVDGVSNVDVGSNITLLSTPTLESIEEFKIITNGYAAEWPRSGGGVVNVVTKSGTSRFKGSAYEFYRSDKLNANSWFRNQSPNPDLRKPPALRYNNFGYTAGGPVLKNKMFFFWSQEWRRIQRAPASLIGNVPNPAWLSDPTNSNYVAPEKRDANAVKFLTAYPAPNLPPTSSNGPSRYAVSSPNINNTRQEVIRIDYDLSPKWRLTGRYTHDLSETQELGGLWLGYAIPNIATTMTTVPGQVLALGVKTIFGSNALNEFQYQRSSNAISWINPDGTKNKRSDYGINIPEIFPENTGRMIPTIAVSGLSSFGTNQLYKNNYVNQTITDNFSWQKGNHAFKFGGLVTFEEKNENALANSQGSFSFVASTGRTAFQNFLLGNADGQCASCSYSEAEKDIIVGLRFNRLELYAQDSWKVRPNLTIDLGLRYSLYPPIREANNALTTFDPSFYKAANAPKFTTATGALIDKTTGSLTNGIIIAGQNSPYGDSIYPMVKDSIQPRFGFSWDPKSTGSTIVRGSFGIYYDQPLVGIFEWNAFYNPPFNNSSSITGASLSNPTAGTTVKTSGVPTIWATSTDFKNPRTTQWNIGVTRQLFKNAVIEVSYVGSRGDNLIRPIDINYPMPADVIALQTATNSTSAVNPARPYLGYGTFRYHETTATSRYQGLLTGFRYQGGKHGTMTVNYTLSRNQTDSTNDRDTIDVPQNPRDPMADFADARTDRRHILTASYVYEVPFFKESKNPILRTAISGWQVAGITYANSGQPVPRISVLTNTFRRGGFADLVGDPNPQLTFVNGVPYWFDPTAFAPPADGKFGNSGRAPFRQPGFYKWDFTLSKNFYLPRNMRLQFRADLINAFNQVNWASDPAATGLDNTCSTSLTSCTVSTDTFGQLIAVRAAREIQFGLKLYW